MREAIGGTWLFQIVIVFVLLFTGFMCLSINRSKAFNVKNYILETIQAYNGDIKGLNDDKKNEAMNDIVDYMQSNAYRTSGEKPDDIKVCDKYTAKYHCYNREGKEDNKNSPVFCLAKINVGTQGCLDSNFNELPDMYYYRIVVFYQLDLPIFHELFNFQITGDTRVFSVTRQG